MRDNRISSLDYNSTEHALLVNSSLNERTYEYQLYLIIEGSDQPKIRKSSGHNAVWISSNRFAVLDSSSTPIVKNLNNQSVNFGGFSSGFLLPKSDSKLNNNIPNGDKLFSGGKSGLIIVKDSNTIVLYDVFKRRRINTGYFENVKYSSWSPDKKFVLLVSKHQLWLCDERLKVVSEFKNRTSIKSVCWYSDFPVILYTTNKQLFYLHVSSGEKGAIATTPETLYIALARNRTVVCLTRRSQIKVLEIPFYL